ncbi:MAG: hypothetical protein J3R72DRAFT_508790 [Linnemannia gamsii]|nr:MAG: hypothetical protein J3R72DRAFT_508790 [Linnemannia gamsii]
MSHTLRAPFTFMPSVKHEFWIVNMNSIYLHLKGWSALTFCPNTRKSIKALMMLKLSTGRPKGYWFIPPVEELDVAYGLEGKVRDEDENEDMNEFPALPGAIVRPIWTWDWDLPRLTLTSEFGHRFHFRMLQGCQALGKLHLYMRTVEGRHTRVIAEADLFVSDAAGTQDRIVAPKLQKLYMNDHWVFEDQDVMTQFLCNIFPGLYQLDARGWSGGIGVRDVVVLLRSCCANQDSEDGFGGTFVDRGGRGQVEDVSSFVCVEEVQGVFAE